MSAIAWLLWNPIVAKEYRSRMRTWRSPVALVVYIVLLAGIGWAIFAALAYSTEHSNGGPGPGNYGQSLFLYLVIFQMLLLAFITPSVTAGAVSGERERQTIDMLFVTLVPPFSIIWGKLLASISFIVLLMLISAPVFSLVFLFGGIEPDQLIAAFIETAVSALTLGALGITCSTLIKRTLPATVAAYGAAFILLPGAMLFGLLFPTVADPHATVLPSPPVATYVGPIVPLVTIATSAPVMGNFGVRGSEVVSGGSGVACSSSSSGVQSCFPIGPNGQSFYAQPVTSGATLTTGPFRGWQYWQASVVMQLAICVIVLLVSGLAIAPTRRAPWPNRGSRSRSSAAPPAL